MSTYSIGSMNQLGDALENSGFTQEDVTKLKQCGNLKAIKDVLYGIAEIKYPEHLIDCDVASFIPDDWTVEQHTPGGIIKFNPKNISLYLSKKQKKGSVSGDDLRKNLAGKKVLNANILDYLLAHPKLIPEEWKGKAIFFWGTIYRCSHGSLGVRCLNWDGSVWDWHCNCLGSGFNPECPAALAS